MTDGDWEKRNYLKLYKEPLPEIKIRGEHRFQYLGRTLKMRHYNDGAWELLDEHNLPIVQGFCSDEGELDTA